MAYSKNLKYYLGIIILASMMYIPLTGRVHLFDWDEINFAESAREMLVTGDYLTVQIDYRAFWEKPPLFIWMQALSMKIFGVNEFAARFPNAICGIVTLLLLFKIGTQIKNKKLGILWALSYGASLLPFLYFKSGIIDPWFNLFIFLGIYYFILFYNKHKTLELVCSALFIGLAVLTKGPAGFIIFGLTVFIYFVLNKFKIKINFKQALVFTLVFAFTGGFWFILQILKGNWGVIKDFIYYQIELFKTEDAGHGGFFLFHFAVLFIGVFPASVFALNPLINKNKDNENIVDFTKWMKILFWVVLILFSIVQTKIVHYSSMCYFPLTFLSAKYIEKWIGSKQKHPIYQNISLYFVAGIFVIMGVGLPLAGFYKDKFIATGIIKDNFVLDILKAQVVWKGFEWISVLWIFCGIVAYYLFYKKNKRYNAIFSLFITTAIFTFSFLILNIKKIEGYTQRTPIEFYISKKNEDCYIKTIRYKSYAPYFYRKQKEPENKQSYYDEEWMLKGNIDKTVYFVSRTMHRGNVEKKAGDDLIFMKEKNGFIFHKREPKQNND